VEVAHAPVLAVPALVRVPVVDGSQHRSPALPALKLASRQADWLRAARTRLLRQTQLASARNIVELGCGWGIVTQELAQRSAAQVIGIDKDLAAIEHAIGNVPRELSERLSFIVGDAYQIPLPDSSQDIVLAQCALLWMRDPARVLSECRRILRPVSGRLVIIEPDYDGLMEYPPEIVTRQLWTDALRASGADPTIGRRLGVLCHMAGLVCQQYLLDRYEPPKADYLEFLRELPLSPIQCKELQQVETAIVRLPSERLTVHLPFWLITAASQTGPD
jgi:SAM-dependent methyltransferase